MYYLADGDTYLCCESLELAEHLIKNGCHYATKEEFEVGERRHHQRICLKFALREVLAQLLARA